MAKGKRFLLHKQKDDESSFEIDLAPMLALMVTLIPVMLLSTVFVRITLIETPLPQVVQQAIEKDRNKKDRVVNFVLEMSNQNGFIMQVEVDGKITEKIRMPKTNNKWDLAGLYNTAHNLKMKNPDVFRVDLKPQANVKYEDIVKAMDELRMIKGTDKKAEITDSNTKQKAQTDLMFPEINFANVVEG